MQHAKHRRNVIGCLNVRYQPVVMAEVPYHIVVVPHGLVSVDKVGGGAVEGDDPQRVALEYLREIVTLPLSGTATGKAGDE